MPTKQARCATEPPGTKPTYHSLLHRCETHITSNSPRNGARERHRLALKGSSKLFNDWKHFIWRLSNDPCSLYINVLRLARHGIGSFANSCLLFFCSGCRVPPDKAIR